MLSSQMGAGASYIAHLVPQIRGQLRSLPDISTTESSLEPERDRLYLFDAITTFLKNVSLAAPLMLVFDDLHAADVPSLLLLQFFARELHDSRILVLGTYRDVEARGMPAVPGHLSSILRDGHPIHLGL